MSEALVTAFQSLIPAGFVLPRSGNYWLVEEPGAPHSRLEIAGGKSQAFTLDRDGLAVFPFFSNALSGVNAVNDAIVVSVIGSDTYVVAIEMKTARSKATVALLQIESGRLFSAWAKGLLSFHGHWAGGPCKFFGVVSLKPRKQVRKGGTARSSKLPSPKPSPHGGGYPYFVLENHPRISIANLVAKVSADAISCSDI